MYCRSFIFSSIFLLNKLISIKERKVDRDGKSPGKLREKSGKALELDNDTIVDTLFCCELIVNYSTCCSFVKGIREYS